MELMENMKFYLFSGIVLARCEGGDATYRGDVERMGCYTNKRMDSRRGNL